MANQITIKVTLDELRLLVDAMGEYWEGEELYSRLEVLLDEHTIPEEDVDGQSKDEGVE